MFPAAQALALAVLFAPAANAEVRRQFTLEYQGSVSCPTRAELLAEVQRRAPRAEPVVLGPHQVNARLRVEANGDRQRGIVDIETSEGTTHREVEAAECAEVVRALALIVAIAIEPDSSIAEPTRRPENESRPATARASAKESLKTRWAAGAGIGFSGGVAPTPSLTEAVFLELGRGPNQGFSANVHLAGIHAHGSAAARAGSAVFDLLALRVATCPYRLGVRVVLSGCVSFDWGSLHGNGSHTVAARSTAARWLGPGALVNAALPVLPWLHAQLEVGALLPLSRDSFYFAPDETVHRIPTLAGYGGFNLMVGG